MKKYIILFFILLSTVVFGQNNQQIMSGSISFISAQNIYVKFVNTNGIEIGDTLYVQNSNQLQPALVVKNLSSISCICSPLANGDFVVSTTIYAKKHIEIQPTEDKLRNSTEAVAVNDILINNITPTKQNSEFTSNITGRISATSYTNLFENYINDNIKYQHNANERLRYNLTLNANHIANSKLSAETNLSFTHLLSFPHRPTDWTGLNNALKIYNLALKYEFSKTATIWLGRRINTNMANIGAVDGLQFENNGKHISYGALVGSRPDYTDYSFNAKLLQYGAFVGHNLQYKQGFMQTSVGFFNQMNNLKTDRRFAYFQHSNSLLNKVQLFCSLEFDLYSMQNNQPKTVFDLTNTYVSIAYQPWRQLSFNLSYDARKNIYYYETFRNFIDSLLDKSTRQGFRAGTTIRPLRNLSIGANAGYRLPTNIKNDTTASMNANGYITYTQLPLDISATLNATTFKTGYTLGTVYGAMLSRDFLDGKMNVDVQYRLANYNISRSYPSTQNIAEFDISWRIAKKTYLSADYEATFEKDSNGKHMNSSRIFLSISQRL